MIGYALCGSFCTHARALDTLRCLRARGHEIRPIVSDIVSRYDTRFGRAGDLLNELAQICGRDVIRTVVEAEPLGPKEKLDLLIIAPCTGNTLAKLACGITDTTVTMAAKAQLRADRPILLGLASNDALSANLQNIAALHMHRHITFAPMAMDDKTGKPYSLVCDFTAIPDLAESILKSRQHR
ncbi:MAG: dipicolinate synthase subunit B [Clostridia bacterium]|nr:dipicolinate synthase subunit B [Clostridia bacterium]